MYVYAHIASMTRKGFWETQVSNCGVRVQGPGCRGVTLRLAIWSPFQKARMLLPFSLSLAHTLPSRLRVQVAGTRAAYVAPYALSRSHPPHTPSRTFLAAIWSAWTHIVCEPGFRIVVFGFSVHHLAPGNVRGLDDAPEQLVRVRRQVR